MSEILTSREDAAEMKRSINAAADQLERAGFGRSQIGAAMAGIGLGMVAARSAGDAMKIIEHLGDVLIMDGRKPS